MNISASLLLSAILLAVVGCAGENSNDDNSSGTCTSSHECINGACQCTTEGKSGNACDDPDDCESACEVCN